MIYQIGKRTDVTIETLDEEDRVERRVETVNSWCEEADLAEHLSRIIKSLPQGIQVTFTIISMEGRLDPVTKKPKGN